MKSIGDKLDVITKDVAELKKDVAELKKDVAQIKKGEPSAGTSMISNITKGIVVGLSLAAPF